MSDLWPQVPLGELIEQRTDFTPMIDGEVYRCAGVQRSGWGLLEREPFLGGVSKFSKLMKLERDNLVYRGITAFEAPSAVVEKQFEGLFVSPQTFPVFRIDESRLLPAFMQLITTFPEFHEAMASRCTGTVLRRKTISVTAFKSIQIGLPSLPKQHRIIDLIGSLDDAIEAADQTAMSTNEFLLQAVRSVEARSARTVQVQQFAQLVYGSALKALDRNPGAVPVFGAAGEVGRHSKINTPAGEPVVVIGRKGVDARGRFPAPLRTSPVDERGWGGAGSVRWSDEPVWVIDTAYFVALRAGVDRRAAYWSLVLVDLPSVATKTTLPGLSREIAHHQSAVAPEEFDDETLDLLELAENACVAAAEQRTRLRSLRTELLAACLSGEHVIPASYDQVMEAAA